jgi:hypothetical protein
MPNALLLLYENCKDGYAFDNKQKFLFSKFFIVPAIWKNQHLAVTAIT